MDGKGMMHGQDWLGEDLTGWLLSEKLNGCRAFWDGQDLWTRGGNAVAIPATWRAELPDMQLDCELWAGRGRFEEARLACQYGRFTPAVRLMVFDVNAAGTFAERWSAAVDVLPELDFMAPVEYWRCDHTRAAVDALNHVQQRGGEGLVARHPDNRYSPGRTRQILKIKETI